MDREIPGRLGRCQGRTLGDPGLEPLGGVALWAIPFPVRLTINLENRL